jgi:hypothetical protein
LHDKQARNDLAMDRAWWITALQWSATVGVIALVMGWLGRSRVRARPAADARRMVHPPGVLIVGLICFAFFAGITVVSNLYPNDTATWWTTAVFVGFALLALSLMMAFFLERHDVSDEGVATRTFVGTRKSIRWADLAAVRYAPSMKWFRLETGSGTVARISVMLMGLPEFARVLLQHAPPGAIDAATLDVLRATAAGNPPSVWA